MAKAGNKLETNAVHTLAGPPDTSTHVGTRSIGWALLRAIVFVPVVLGPVIVGIPQEFNTWFRALVAGVLLGFVPGVLAILSTSKSEAAQKTVWAIVSVCLSLTVVDIGLRPVKLPIVVEPDRTYVWAPMPLVKRFDPNVRYHGTTYGGLASEVGMPGLAHVREYTVITDRFGFRNERLPQQPLDLITLGDSFTAGHGITQDRVWPAVLAKRHGLAVYNLGISGNGPWHDYANFLMEVDRLPLRDRGTVAIWNLYTGAVLRPCEGIFDKQELPWRTGLGAFKTSAKNFRVHSPLGQLVPRLWARATAGRIQAGSNRDIMVRRFPNGSESFFVSWDRLESHRSLEAVRNHPDYGCVKKTIVAAKRLAQSKNVTLGILVAPTKDEVYPWVVDGGPPWSASSEPSGLAAAIAEICKEERIPFLDLKPALIAAAKRVYDQSGAYLYWRDDTHWSLEGNDEVANVAHQFYMSLRSSGPPSN